MITFAAAILFTRSISSQSVCPGQDTSFSWPEQGKCYLDEPKARIFGRNDDGVHVFSWHDKQRTATDKMKKDECITFCAASGYSLAGVEFGNQCFCGSIKDLEEKKATEKDMKECQNEQYRCPKNKGEFCGSHNRMLVYKVPQYIDGQCYQDSDKRFFGGAADSGHAVNPSAVSFEKDSMTIEGCKDYCVDPSKNGKERAYPFAAVQYGKHCFCGTMEEYQAAQNKKIQSSRCDKKCSGNPAQNCGGSWTSNVYKTSAFVDDCPSSGTNNPGGDIVFNPSSLDVLLDGQIDQSVSLKLPEKPSENVTVTLQGSGVTFSKCQFTFTPNNYDVPQSLQISGTPVFMSKVANNCPIDVQITQGAITKSNTFILQRHIAPEGTCASSSPNEYTLLDGTSRFALPAAAGTYHLFTNPFMTIQATLNQMQNDVRAQAVAIRYGESLVTLDVTGQVLPDNMIANQKNLIQVQITKRSTSTPAKPIQYTISLPDGTTVTIDISSIVNKFFITFNLKIARGNQNNGGLCNVIKSDRKLFSSSSGPAFQWLEQSSRDAFAKSWLVKEFENLFKGKMIPAPSVFPGKGLKCSLDSGSLGNGSSNNGGSTGSGSSGNNSGNNGSNNGNGSGSSGNNSGNNGSNNGNGSGSSGNNSGNNGSNNGNGSGSSGNNGGNNGSNNGNGSGSSGNNNGNNGSGSNGMLNGSSGNEYIGTDSFDVFSGSTSTSNYTIYIFLMSLLFMIQ